MTAYLSPPPNISLLATPLKFWDSIPQRNFQARWQHAISNAKKDFWINWILHDRATCYFLVLCFWVRKCRFFGSRNFELSKMHNAYNLHHAYCICTFWPIYLIPCFFFSVLNPPWGSQQSGLWTRWPWNTPEPSPRATSTWKISSPTGITDPLRFF